MPQMKMTDKLEKWLGPYAVQGLIRYVVALNALVFILLTIHPAYIDALRLDRTAVLHGEIWRLVSWIFIPETTGMFWIIFYLMFTWWIGDMLEETWGTFRLNLYYFSGMVLCIASAFIFGASGGNFFLNLSLFLAVATLMPDFEIALFLILPVKIKWVALFSLIGPLGYLVFGELPLKMMVVMCLGNYLLFFGPVFFRNRMVDRKNIQRQTKFKKAALSTSESLHYCETCGATEQKNPDAEFRVAADGKEYCIEHLPSRQN